MRRVLVSVMVMVIVSVSGCGEKKEKSAPAATPTSGSGAKPPVKPAAAAAPAIPEADARALVDRWREAQNKGDLEAYSGLYATRMTGIKRIGARTFTFDRAGWLADRGRMFKKPMKVEASDVSVKVSGPSAVVHLQQSFEQGAFHDVGPKQIVVVREPAGLRIAREEMLDSLVLKPGEAAGGGGAPSVYLVVDGDLLLVRGADPAWRRGDLELEASGDDPSHKVHTGVDRKLVDPAVMALMGKTFTAYDAKGAMCSGRLGSLGLVAGVTPHFGTVQEWQGADGPLGEGPVATEDEIAASVWESGEPILLGQLDGCTGLVAVPGEGKAVVFAQEVDGRSAEAVMVAFRALPAWKAIQKDFAEEGGDGLWDGQPEVAIFRHPTSKATWAVVHAREGEGCGHFEGELTAVFERTGSTWKNRSAPDATPFSLPDVALDLDLDGKPEFILDRHIISDQGSGYDVTDSYSWPYHDCPC